MNIALHTACPCYFHVCSLCHSQKKTLLESSQSQKSPTELETWIMKSYSYTVQLLCQYSYAGEHWRCHKWKHAVRWDHLPPIQMEVVHAGNTFSIELQQWHGMYTVKTDWLFEWKSGYLGCILDEETLVRRSLLETNCLRQLERKLVQIIISLQLQSLTS